MDKSQDIEIELKTQILFHLRFSAPGFHDFVFDRIRKALPHSVFNALGNSYWSFLNEDELTLFVEYLDNVEIIQAHLWMELDLFCNIVAELTGVTQIQLAGSDGVWQCIYESTNKRWIREIL